ncbi:hypothetical protein BMR38_15830 [Escherichia coli]|nr:hypothetical protein BMR38_15830 [Escherichia coli]
MPAFEWVHVQLHQQKGMISLSPPTICNSAIFISFLTDIIYIAISLTIRDKLTPSFSRYISICSSIFILGTGIYFILT